MPWFKVDDGLAFSLKAVGAGNSAMGLWVRAGSWSSQQLSDGFVPGPMVLALGGGTADADALVTAGLWETAPDGFLFHDWAEYQPTREQVLAERAAAAERKRKSREHRTESQRDTQSDNHRDSLFESQPPVPSRPVPSQTDITNPGQNVQLVTARDTDLTEFIHSESEKLGIKSLGRIRKAVSRCLPILAVPTDAELIDLTRLVIDLSPSVVRHPEAYVETTAKASPHEITVAWARLSRPEAVA